MTAAFYIAAILLFAIATMFLAFSVLGRLNRNEETSLEVRPGSLTLSGEMPAYTRGSAVPTTEVHWVG